MHRRLSATLVLLAITATAAPALATENVTVRRLEGANRYETAARIFQATNATRPLGPPALALGTNFPDALSAINVIGTREFGSASPSGVLLTPFADLPAATRDVISQGDFASVVISGDTDVVSTRVEQQVRDLGPQTEREAGRNRYETAANAVLRGYQQEYQNNARTKIDGLTTVLMVSGANYADAIAAGPLAYGEQLPLLLTTPDRLNETTRILLTRDLSNLVEQVILVGGAAALAPQVQADLEALGIVVRRVSGSNRQETAVEVFKFAELEFSWTLEHVNLARGDDFPDAIAGGPHAGEEKAPILLTGSKDDLSAVTRNFLRERSSTIGSIDMFGSQAAVSEAVVSDAREAATTP